jgi:hypothetical protein
MLPRRMLFQVQTTCTVACLAACAVVAGRAGPGAGRRLIGGLLANNALYRLRAAQGVLGLADKHQPGRLGAACGKAAVQAGQPEERMAALADTPYALALNPGTRRPSSARCCQPADALAAPAWPPPSLRDMQSAPS